MKDDVMIRVYMTKCLCMNVKQVNKLIKLKENKSCEESHRNNDR